MIFVIIIIFFTSIIFMISGWRFYKYLRYILTIQNTPTSSIRSVSQGYAEICGTLLKPSVKSPTISPYGKEECVWFRCTIEQSSTSVKSIGASYYRYEPINWFCRTFLRFDPKWKLLEESMSAEDLIVDDETGLCRINADGAEIIANKRIWYSTDGYHRYTEQYLYEGDILYAIGYIQNRSAVENITVEGLQAEVIRDWKQNYVQLKHRFHLENDQPTMEEWQKICDTALEIAEKRYQKLAHEPAQNYLKKPDNNNLPFVLANTYEEDLIDIFKKPLLFSATVCLISALLTVYTLIHYHFL